ncbi:DUF3048 domain-containing protein [Candidatus Microgenomates bacterium]|nr:DUF3048 domain-containing protein [Candidatus Microgenomates bacterium]
MNKENLFKDLFMNKKLTLIFSFLGLFLISVGISWGAFSFLSKGGNYQTSKNTKDARSKINLNLPKTEECPINGEMFTKPEKEIWEKRRPLLAVIENHKDARPQSGISHADVTYEVVAEGGITRFLNVFYCRASAEDFKIGPIRSARVYLINWASEYAEFPIFLHVGGANNICKNCPGGVKPAGDVASKVNAFDLMTKINWRYANGPAMDGGTNIGYPAVYRDYERIPGAAAEHTMMAQTDKIFAEAEKRGFAAKDSNGKLWSAGFTQWKFADGKADASGNAKDISYKFWGNDLGNDYTVQWKYDSSTNQYLRTNGGQSHTDMETKQQLAASDVVTMFVKEDGPVDKEHHMYYEVVGTGKALVFQNGTMIEGTWKKASRTARTIFYDSNGKEIIFVRGKIWISALPVGNDVTYN